jgi:uncharacterized membrane protein (UPF0127 family)
MRFIWSLTSFKALTAFALLASANIGACNRADNRADRPEARNPHDDASETLQTSTSVTPVATAPSQPSRCVIPLANEPAARAKKAETCPRDPTGPLALPKGYVRFPEAPGSPRIDVEFAVDPAHKERGLMYRTSMPDEQGMLFSWSDEQVRTFWMRNTCIPLDMMFIAADGFITGILEEVPTLNDSPRSIACPAGYVLEVNAGWSRAHGVKPGTKIIIEK